eukprot:CAMPEP_0197389342 /NCGR_PEP_ID=MMETSP1165-20131217/1640_1 /TAXON_ID=284809 /ORGANISM="Chrysocystis fragilis, Strain CCMP3189" /LENGTH=90 /DNA_ID=CAMNT_0042914749 /DNA_START=10 /DNA_END=283 /DNA_ORIENTATION=-
MACGPQARRHNRCNRTWRGPFSLFCSHSVKRRVQAKTHQARARGRQRRLLDALLGPHNAGDTTSSSSFRAIQAMLPRHSFRRRVHAAQCL